MFPFSFEWTWDIAHVIFMGGLWYALGILGAGLTFVIGKAAYETMNEDTMNDNGDAHH
jgi:hypothetical protein